MIRNLKSHLESLKLVVVLTPDNSVSDAVNVMFLNDETYVMLLENDHVVGIFTDSDLTRRVVAKNLNQSTTKLLDVMTTDLVTIDIEDTIDDCVIQLCHSKIRHLPVLSNGILVAVSSVQNLLQLALKEVIIEREHLKSYICM